MDFLEIYTVESFANYLLLSSVLYMNTFSKKKQRSSTGQQSETKRISFILGIALFLFQLCIQVNRFMPSTKHLEHLSTLQ